ncbi:hypothetical protein [Halobacillus seohaensis]|uniref:Resolvase/invertase-type recombinase catalytic domain-containing protein n=1 Tax=Halobacillus seohaensis TaxID=447421 RepID=A0ABW2ES07_9BACI
MVVYKLDRIGRSTKHLVDLINNFGILFLLMRVLIPQQQWGNFRCA